MANAVASEEVRTPPDRADNIIEREKEALREMKTAINALVVLTARVKAEGVKMKVDTIANAFDRVLKMRCELQAEARARICAADHLMSVSVVKITDRVGALETKIMDGLVRATADKADQGRFPATAVATATVPPPSQAVETQRWVEVARRNRGRSARTATAATVATNQTNAAAARGARTPRARPMALSVRLDGEDFPALLKTVRRKVDPGVTGDSIAKIRKTLAGDLLIEINGGSTAADVVKTEVMRSLGPEAKVRKLEDTATVEIRDLDAETTREEVIEEARKYDAEARLVNLRPVYGGTQTAVVALSTSVARKLCSTGRLRIGLVFTRVRSVELPERCFKCLAFGHTRRVCEGVERGDCCWRCGETGHKSRDCGAGTEAAATFQAVLASEARRNRTWTGPRGSGTELEMEHGKLGQDGAETEVRGDAMNSNNDQNTSN